jgi:hypothetical protein
MNTVTDEATRKYKTKSRPKISAVRSVPDRRICPSKVTSEIVISEASEVFFKSSMRRLLAGGRIASSA